MNLIKFVRNFYGKFERPISSFSLIFGFIFDAVTLQRVDTLWENIWVLGHLVIVGLFMILIHSHKYNDGDEIDPSKAHFWFVNILQFFFGGILSTYLVFYFRSADILVTWPFILILAVAFIANESLKRHYIRLSFQISLFFISIYSFAIFLVPVIIHKIGWQVFIFSGFCSLVFIFLFINVLFFFSKEKFLDKKKGIYSIIGIIYIVVNFLYFTNLIPPIPLSLKEGGIYNDLHRDSDGNYIVQYEDLGFKGYFQLYQDYKQLPGSFVYAFSAVFSPTNLNTTIVHEWQYYNIEKGEWIKEGRISLPVIGGRENGFRTYSVRSNLLPGKWRVNVETLEGQIIGRLRFNVVPVKLNPLLVSDIQ